MFRAKARWFKERKKNIKYFFRLEKQKYNNKAMSCLVRDDGTISRKQKEILEIQ